MKPAAKRKNLQAQRKFAQGVIIPRNQNEQRRDSASSEYPSPIIIRNIRVAMMATNLLDHITFRNLLRNMQPRVVLERLHCTIVKNKENENVEDLAHTSRMTRSKSHSITKTSTRSSIRNIKTKDKISKKKQATICDDFSFDDNRPLTFFKKNRNVISTQQYKKTQSQTDAKENESIIVEPQNTLQITEDSPSIITIGYQVTNQFYESLDIDQAMECTKLSDSSNSKLVLQQNDMDSQNSNTSSEVIDTQEECITSENIPCPSTKYIKAKEVLTAPKEELDKRCQICNICKTIDKLLYIATIVQQPLSLSQGETRDVYQFNGVEEENPPPLAMLTRNRRTSANLTSNCDFIPVYLDILSNECTHVIQIMLNGNNGKMLKTRLVPKNLSNPNNELSLSDHRDLLDQLLATLNESSNRRISEIKNGSTLDYETMVLHDAQWWKMNFNADRHRVICPNSHKEDQLVSSVKSSTKNETVAASSTVVNITELPDRNDIEFVFIDDDCVEQGKIDSPDDSDCVEQGKIDSPDDSDCVEQGKIDSPDDSDCVEQGKIDSPDDNDCIEQGKIDSPDDSDSDIRLYYDTSDTDDLDGIEMISDEYRETTPDEPETTSTATNITTVMIHSVPNVTNDCQPNHITMETEEETEIPTFTEAEIDQIANDMCLEQLPAVEQAKSSQFDDKQELTSSESVFAGRKPSQITSAKALQLFKEHTGSHMTRVLHQQLSNRSTGIEKELNLCSDSTQPSETITQNKEKPETSKKIEENRINSPEVSLREKLVEALVFYPTKKEFTISIAKMFTSIYLYLVFCNIFISIISLDPLAYFEKIMPIAKKFGLCKIVPPDNFKPTCYINDDMRFTVSNQYIARMYNRWGHAQREMCGIKVNSALQGVVFNRAPLMDCMEVNLLKLYHSVQRCGGYKKFTEEKCWTRITEELRLNQCPNPEKKLEYIYLKFLLSYYTLTYEERKELMGKVDYHWQKNNKKMIERAVNPLHRQKKLCESESSSDEDDNMDRAIASALTEAEECVAPGRQMNLGMFKKIAANMMHVHFPDNPNPTVEKVENEYWRIVLFALEHVCVNTASVDTGPQGYGFTKNKNDIYGKHPWNLKVLSQNPSNVLRSLDQVLGITVPTLHLGMVFSCSCWHRDPHGLPWMEYMHLGPGKVWYGIPDEQSENFRKVVEKVCPTSYQNKSVWLPSDIAMIPPKLLLENDVALSRVVQQPGEYIIVFPKAYSCSITTGYTQSESACFATNSWFMSVVQVFQELRNSCEPSAFSLEQLLGKVACDRRVSVVVFQRVHAILTTVVEDELHYRNTLEEMGVKNVNIEAYNRQRRNRGWTSRNEECEVCRTSLYFSKVFGIITKKSQVCLMHAVKLLKIPDYKVKPSQVEMILPFSNEELQGLLTKIEGRLSEY